MEIEAKERQLRRVVMAWGKGWEVSVNRAQWQHEQAMRQAAEVLKREHGERHKSGERRDLCPSCQALE